MSRVQSLVVGVVALSCRARAPSEPPHDPAAEAPQRTAPQGGDGERHAFVFRPGAMHAAPCEIRIDSAWIMLVTEVYAFTPTWDADARTMRIQLRRAAMGMSIDGMSGLVLHEPDRIEERGPGKPVRVTRASDDPKTARKLAAMFGAPHVSLELDGSAGITAFSNDFEENQSAAVIGLYWFSGVPVFPSDAAVGDTWIAERPFASPSPVATPTIALEYRLQAVRDGYATIAISTAPIQARRGHPERHWRLNGTSRVRVADGAFVDSNLTADLGADDDPAHVRWTIVAKCGLSLP